VARHVRAGHPWVYREAIGQRVLRAQPGEPIEIVDVDGDFVGRGIYDGESAIAIRVVTRNSERSVTPELLAERVRAAINLRRELVDMERYQCVRMVNAESDGVPAVVIERYGDYIVSQLYSRSITGYRDAIYDALEAELKPRAIYEQRRFKSLGGDAPRQGAAELVRGEPAPVEFEVREGDLKFWVDVTAPLSTGLFADLRDGRAEVARWSKDRTVLNMFSYTGAISVYAAHGGATHVTAIDVAAKAHARARKNFSLNGFDAEAVEHIVGDTFKVLARFAERDRKFDVVIIDPPAFASGSRGGKPWSAVQDYGELVAASLGVLSKGGLLIAASSTRKLDTHGFEMALAEGAARAGTDLRIVSRANLPVDFPQLPAFPESNYLKFVVCKRR
jgi:23S rRNA (cytosine1962-C5)-methyltransferase